VAEVVREFHPEHPEPPEFLLDIEDRDLWRFERKSTKDVFAAVTSYPHTVEQWDRFLDTDYDALRLEGISINRYRDQLIGQCVANAYEVQIVTPDSEIWIPCADAPYSVGSDAAGELAKTSRIGVAAYSIHHGNEVQFGLRATAESEWDVAQLAAFYGGGGHVKASGFRVKDGLEERKRP
jgi:nanoRNase/pAp phosphatase (c-di-AMP/oligoRNAs hydrolase)